MGHQVNKATLELLDQLVEQEAPGLLVLLGPMALQEIAVLVDLLDLLDLVEHQDQREIKAQQDQQDLQVHWDH